MAATKQAPKPLKIVRLRAENFKRLRAVEIVPGPDGSLVMITGRNGQGKSSVLDAIMAALGGARALPAQPIRKGEDKSRIVLDLGDLIVERTITQGGGEVKVKAANGSLFPSPQAMLDALIGKIAFDPLAFMRLAGKDQVKQLLQVVDLGFNPAELDYEKVQLDETYREWGREVKRLQGAVDSLPASVLGRDEIELSLADITASHNQLQAENRARELALADAQAIAARHGLMRHQIKDIEQRIAELQIELANAQHDATTLEIGAQQALKKAEAMPMHDVGNLAAQIQQVEAHNAAVRQAQAYFGAQDELAKAKNQREDYEYKRVEVEQRKATLLAQAKMPVPGLSFTGDQLFLNGIQLEQCSASEQLRVAVAIAMALNPQLRVITIRDGSLLDSDSLKMIGDLADGHGYQVWIEQVDESGEMGVVIEDGMVVPSAPELIEPTGERNA